MSSISSLLVTITEMEKIIKKKVISALELISKCYVH